MGAVQVLYDAVTLVAINAQHVSFVVVREDLLEDIVSPFVGAFHFTVPQRFLRVSHSHAGFNILDAFLLRRV